MLSTREDIIKYIPQREPMVMVHNIVEADEDCATTQLEVLSENIFVEGGLFREPGLIENIAQTAAAQMGYAFKSRGMPVPIGYIASVKDLSVFNLPPVGALLTTSTRVTANVMNVTLVEGVVRYNDLIVCSCEMRIFVGKEGT